MISASMSILIRENTISIPAATFGGNAVIATNGIVISNDAVGLLEDFELSATKFFDGIADATSNTWSYSQTLTAAADTIVLAGVVLSMGANCIPVAGNFPNTTSIISDGAKMMTATNFQVATSGACEADAGTDDDGDSVASTLPLSMWFYVKPPTSSSFEVNNPTATFYVTALAGNSF
ncbi:MAG: hypothetical protein AABZ44_07250 [Elusimicrobiota bacterium]